ncbi:MAG TPA: stage III sporulation protein AH [Syntrophomonadaceae bacterium]|nr:stage III sporulation protein AH [Syntrophomonadaceae bacterium]
MLIVAGSLINPAASTTSPPAPAKEEVQRDDSLTAAEKELESRLEKVLGSVAGAGSVQVTVTLSSGQENVFAQNINKQNRIIEEKDQAGGNRKTTEVNEQGSLVFAETLNGGKDDPVLIKAKRPEVAGVLVLAEGAKDPELREKLAQAVETLLDIPPHKVTVLAKESW